MFSNVSLLLIAMEIYTPRRWSLLAELVDETLLLRHKPQTQDSQGLQNRGSNMKMFHNFVSITAAFACKLPSKRYKVQGTGAAARKPRSREINTPLSMQTTRIPLRISLSQGWMFPSPMPSRRKSSGSTVKCAADRLVSFSARLFLKSASLFPSKTKSSISSTKFIIHKESIPKDSMKIHLPQTSISHDSSIINYKRIPPITFQFS